VRQFILYRHYDVTGVSGVGVVAEGVEFSDKTVAVRWLSSSPSTVIWNSIEDLIQVSGHGGATEIVFRDSQGSYIHTETMRLKAIA
jgi:hypothetical protein